MAPKTDPVPKGTRVDVVADRLDYDGKTEVATATGTVQLTYGPYVLTATRVVYNMKTGKFSANGSIVFREPNGNVLEADFAELEDNFKAGFARHVRALLTTMSPSPRAMPAASRTASPSTSRRAIPPARPA